MIITGPVPYQSGHPISPCQPSITVAYQISAAKAHNVGLRMFVYELKSSELKKPNLLPAHVNIDYETWELFVLQEHRHAYMASVQKSHIPNLAGKIGRARAEVFRFKS